MQATILNQQFQSAFSDGKHYSDEEFFRKTGMANLNLQEMADIIISEEGIKKTAYETRPLQSPWSRWYRTSHS
jgi:hypothetical protein